MRVLVAWDIPSEAELLSLYLSSGGENDVIVVESADELLARARAEVWDAVLLALTYPQTVEEGFGLFNQLQPLLQGTPLVMACRPAEMIDMPRFLMRGLRFYIYRDPQGDFIFLLLATLESALAAYRAEEERKIAEHLRREINGVRLLQEAIIPHGLQPPVGYRAAARYEPAQITSMGGQPVILAGGDYYDLFRADDHTLIALVGDASGHGLKACMSIMTMHTLVRMLGQARFADTAGFVTEINSMLCSNSIVQSGGGFITLLYVIVNTQSHQVTWTSAGHPFALLQRLDSNQIEQVGGKEDGGMPLGITDAVEYTALNFTMPPRSRLLLYSDGLTDALAPGEDEGGNAYGLEGILQTLRRCAGLSLEDTMEQLFCDSHAYTGGAGRHDDTSILLLERDV
ncbi:MAG: SpoIIE family protein phosphatase [Gemmataceae bacterium]